MGHLDEDELAVERAVQSEHLIRVRVGVRIGVAVRVRVRSASTVAWCITYCGLAIHAMQCLTWCTAFVTYHGE